MSEANPDPRFPGRFTPTTLARAGFVTVALVLRRLYELCRRGGRYPHGVPVKSGRSSLGVYRGGHPRSRPLFSRIGYHYSSNLREKRYTEIGK